jgi:hypothetical protein
MFDICRVFMDSEVRKSGEIKTKKTTEIIEISSISEIILSLMDRVVS